MALFVWAAVICYAQVYVGVHYPTDILGGTLLGCLAGSLSGGFFNRRIGLELLPEKQHEHSLPYTHPGRHRFWRHDPHDFQRISPGLPIYLLAFTGAFLFGVTIMHLLPEVYHELGHSAGIYIVIGFFLQVFLQQLSHGMEHGHTHLPAADGHHHHIAVTPLLVGLSIHAFMEGIPLGFHYEDKSALPSLMLGVMAHKIPESLTLITVMIHAGQSRAKLWRILIIFSW